MVEFGLTQVDLAKHLTKRLAVTEVGVIGILEIALTMQVSK